MLSFLNILRMHFMRFSSLVGVALFSFNLVAAEKTNNLELTGKIPTNAPIVSGPRDPDIARLTARILERQHFSQMPFDKTVSSKFLDRYLDALDNQRLHFLQSDIDAFNVYRDQLDELTVGKGDTSPANLIFLRFRQRMEERVAFVQEMLPKQSFEFKTDDKILINRKDQPWAKDFTEAKKLWLERLRYEILQEKLNKEKPEETVKIISRRYNRILRSIEELDSDDVLQIYLTALTHVYDPHSDYFGKAQLENFSIGMKLSLFGIGAVLSSEDGYCKVKELMPEGPAAKSKKLKPEDRIIAVAQGTNTPVDAVDMKLNKVVDMIRGAKGTEVRLTVIPADAPDPSVRKIVTLIRDEIKLEDQQAKARLIEMPDDKGKPIRLGYIDLPSFYSDFDAPSKASADRKSTTTDVSKLVKKLKQEKVSGIILDLRRNGGGSLEEAINLTGLFIKSGTVVQVKDPDGGIIRDNDTDPSVLYDGPLMVLTSRFSASASEILAGALQDYGRALVVGDKSTHGKGTVQSLIQLSPYLRQFEGVPKVNPGAIKVTIRKFYRANGESTQLKGVTPDLVLPSVNNVLEVGESSLENPLPWDTIPSADFEKLNLVSPFLSDLKTRMEKRVAASREYDFVREDIDKYKKSQEEKAVSLNEAKRRKEKKEAEERSKARKKELALRTEPVEKIYEITLKLAEQPGLPAPLAKTNLVTSVSGSKTSTSGASTNSAAVPTSKKKTHSDDEDEESTADTTPARDLTLEEAKRILVDYVNLSGRRTELSLKAVK